MKKKILAGVLSAAMVATTAITAMNVFAADGKMVNYYDEDNWTGYKYNDPIEYDGEREIAYDQTLSFEVDQVIDGEDSGASAKVWMVHHAKANLKTIFYIEVTDSDVVAPTDAQKNGNAVAEENFDCVSILVDSDRGGYKALAENDEWWTANATADDNGFQPDMPRWQSKQYINRIDASGYPALHWPNGDYFGTEGEGNAITSGAAPQVYYEKTETGYILEFSLRGINFSTEGVNGLAIVLTDVDSEGNVTRYAQKADIDPTDLKTFECFTNLSELDDQILPSKIQSDTVTGSDTGTDTGSDTGSDTTTGGDDKPPVIDITEVFTDVDKDAWYYNYVSYAYTHKLMKGTSETTFEPAMIMTRAQFVQLFANLDGAELGEYTETKFEDVDMNEWYGPAVAWAEANGVVNGTSETTFSPLEEITREQMCVLIVNYAEYANIDLEGALTDMLAELLAAFGIENSEDFDLDELQALMDEITLGDIFTDADAVSSWAAEAVESCAKAGIINGTGDGTFNPLGTADRASVATLITNFCMVFVD